MEQNSDKEAGENTSMTKKGCVACRASTHNARKAKACKYYDWPEKEFQEEIVRIEGV